MPSSPSLAIHTCATDPTPYELVPGTTHLKRLLPAAPPPSTVDIHTQHHAQSAPLQPSTQDLTTIAATLLSPVLAVIDAQSSPRILHSPRYSVQVRAHASMLQRGVLNAARLTGIPASHSKRPIRIAGVRIMRTSDPRRFDFVARTTRAFGPQQRHQFLAGAIGRSDTQLARTPWVLHAVRAL